jgi:hypothetical protein
VQGGALNATLPYSLSSEAAAGRRSVFEASSHFTRSRAGSDRGDEDRRRRSGRTRTSDPCIGPSDKHAKGKLDSTFEVGISNHVSIAAFDANADN